MLKLIPVNCAISRVRLLIPHLTTTVSTASKTTPLLQTAFKEIQDVPASSFPEGDNPQRVYLENISFTCSQKVLACFRVGETLVVQPLSHVMKR